MSAREGFPISAPPEQQAAGQAVNTMQVGAEALLDIGVGYDVSGILVIGPRPECRGTVADIIGTPEHSDLKEAILLVANQAKDAGQDPGEAVSAAISVFARRDGQGNIERVPEEQLKKN